MGNNNIHEVLLTEAYKLQINKWLRQDNLQLKRIYKGSVDGFGAYQFHNKCDNRGATITIIKSDKDEVFGGYTDIKWSSDKHQIKMDGNSFLFSLTKNTRHKHRGVNEEICGHPFSGPIFGQADIYISDNADLVDSNISRLGSSYHSPENLQSHSTSYLAGHTNFRVKDIEVYQVNNTVLLSRSLFNCFSQ